MYTRTLLAVILAIAIIAAVTPVSLAHALGYQETSQHHYKWTIMVYMDADNNLEDAGISDFNEMEVAGSTSDVAIVVLMDRIPGYDSSNGNWTDARIYLVLHDTDNQTIHSKLLKDLGEVDMGDPSTVIYFVNYTIHNFPADHYALIFWDHGNGWKNRQAGIPVRGCCWDYTSNDHITEAELRGIMQTLRQMGVHLDIVGFDACLMQMTEVAYDLMGTASIVVASEEYEPWDGWYYSGFLVPLILNPDMTPAELASKIVESYKYYYTQVEPLDWVTLSAVNLTALANAVKDVDTMAMWLTYDVFFYPSNATAVKKARDSAQKFGSGDYIDLYGFAAAINATPGFPYDPRPAAARLLADLNASIIANYAASSEAGAHGISIYFPPDVDWYLEERYWYFDQVQFAVNTWWGWFLDYYFYTMKPTEHLRVKVVAPAVATPGSNITVFILTGYGKADIYVDQLTLTLMTPDGRVEAFQAKPVTPGVYVATLTLPVANSSASYLIKAKADYWFLSADDGAVVYASRELAAIPGISESLSQVRSLVEEYGGVLEGVSGDVATIKTIVGEVNVSLSQLKPVLEGVKGDVAIIKTTVGEINASIEKLAPMIVDIRNGVVTLNTSLGLLEASVDSLNAKLEALAGQVGIVKTSLGEVKATLDALKPSIEAIRGDVATIKTTLGEVNVSVSYLKPKIEKILGNTVVIGTKLGTLTGTIVSIDKNVATIKTDVGTLRLSIASLESSQSKEHKSIEDTLASLNSRLSALQSNVSALSSKLHSQTTLVDSTLALVVVTLIVAAAGAYAAFKKS